jgi:GT2 family glycosyltransferase
VSDAARADRNGGTDLDGLPGLTVLVVNWNGREDLGDCFASLADAGYPDLKVLLVDNGSEDDSVAWTRMHHPEVEILETGRNLRWAGGNNVGLRHLAARGCDDHVLLLNNDTIVPEGSLRRLVRACAADPRAWAATPRIVYAGDPARAWYDGGSIGTRSGWVRHEGIRRLTGRLNPEQRYVGYGTGCALLLAPGTWRRVGEFDEDFFFYGEDADYSLRIRAGGGGILHVPRAVVLHKVSASLGETTPRKAFLRSRSHLHLLRKHWRTRDLPLLAPAQAVYLAGHMAWHLWQGRPATALAVWEGALHEVRRPRQGAGAVDSPAPPMVSSAGEDDI